MANLIEAHRQWATRPPDERFANFQALYDYASTVKRESTEHVYPVRDLQIYSTDLETLTLGMGDRLSLLSNWAFGQMCARIGAPASYLRGLPADIVSSCVYHGMQRDDEEAKILYRQGDPLNPQNQRIFASAFTSPNYGRIWDADVIAALKQAVDGSAWHTPPAYPTDGSQNSGLYASDRDMFVFLVNDEKPIEVENAKLGKGFFCWNSETGSATFGLMTFLYNYVCANHIVWGAEQITELRIIHRHHAPDRFYEEALPMLNRYVENKALTADIENGVFQAMRLPIGDTVEKVEEWFRGKPFTRNEVRQAWNTGMVAGEDVSKLWGMLQGFTAHAKTYSHIDARVDLERRAGALLS